jgi:hypothetical protein
VRRVASHLAARGLSLRVVAAALEGDGRDGAFLTATDKEWEELNGLPKMAECLGQWRGTVYCERLRHPESRDPQVEAWGDGCLEAGPFLFFGDRDLLARIRAELQAPEPP